MRFWLTLWALIVFLGISGPAGASVEKAVGPEGLLQIEQEGKITVRALRGWDRLPEKYMELAQKMRSQANLDLLGADLAQLKTWIDQDDLALYQADLQELAKYLEQGEHLQWSAVPEGETVPAGALLRSGEKRWSQQEQGPATEPDSISQAVSNQEESSADEAMTGQGAAQDTEPAQATTDSIATAPSPPLPGDSGPQDGVEFPINYQLSGTYKVKLEVEGLTPMRTEDEPYFQRRLQELLPGSPAVRAGEEKFCKKWGSDFQNDEQGEAPYNFFMGMATPDQPVRIRIDAPDNPAIILTEDEAEVGISYEPTGKWIRTYEYDQAYGKAEIDFKNEDGVISWTPRIDANGRPVGPRVLGIYMAYKVKKYIRNSEWGLLENRHDRIGWVVVAMPGDVYEHDGKLYEIGQTDSLTSDTAVQVPSPEKFDFEVPEYAQKERAVAMSEDLRHIAWVEAENGEKEGRKRVVTNGIPGKWYDDITGYLLRITLQGEKVFYIATLGNKEFPVCNGADGAMFDNLEFLKLTADGAHTLVGGKVGDNYRVYFDGKLVRETPWRISDAVVSENGKAAWLEGGVANHTKFERVVTAAGFEGPKYAAIHDNLVLRQNSDKPYYIATLEDGKHYLVHGEEEFKPTIRYVKFTVAEDSASYAYVSHDDDGAAFMVIDGKTGPKFSNIWDPATFSPDGQRHIYSAEKGEEKFLVIDGEIFSHSLGKIDSVESPVFSPDGQHWAAGLYLKENGSYVIFKDGKKIGQGQGYPRKITFSPDSNKLAWLEGGETGRAYLDGKAGPKYHKIFSDRPPQFSPDSKHLVYFALDEDSDCHIVLFDGQERIHDQIVPLAVFTDSSVEYVVMEENHVWRESLPLK